MLITILVNKHNSIHCNFHNLRTRKAGNTRYIDLHLVFPPNMSIKAAHDLCDLIEEDIEKLFKNTEILIHIESCEKICTECNLSDSNEFK
jgi:divalent metal cation (Fe/Co/Zn/Cd) transporter